MGQHTKRRKINWVLIAVIVFFVALAIGINYAVRAGATKPVAPAPPSPSVVTSQIAPSSLTPTHKRSEASLTPEKPTHETKESQKP